MTRFIIRAVEDDMGKWWVLFEFGTFHAPTAIIHDSEMVKIANQVLGRKADGRPSMPHLKPDFRALRKRAGLTLKEVSEATDVSISYLSLLERGIRGEHITEKVVMLIDFLNDYEEGV